LDTGGTTIQDPTKESFSVLFDKEIATNSVITDAEYNKLILENPQIVARIQAATGFEFGIKSFDDGSLSQLENNGLGIAADVRENGDSGGLVIGAAVSRPFLVMSTGAVNGVAGLVILGADSDARAQTWSGIKIFAEHPIDNTSTALTNYWNNTTWNQMLEDGFVAGYGAGLSGGAKLVSKLDTSPIITAVDVPSRRGQAGQLGITLTPNPKSTVKNINNTDYGNIPEEHHWRYDRYLNSSTNPKSPDVWYKKAETVWANNINGNSFEKDVRETLNLPLGKGSKPISIDGYIPDLPVGGKFGVTDVKNVQNLSNSGQLKSFYNYAVDNKLDFNLIIGPNTKSISEPLLDNIRNTNGTVKLYDPVTGKFTPIDIGNSGFWRNK